MMGKRSMNGGVDRVQTSVCITLECEASSVRFLSYAWNLDSCEMGLGGQETPFVAAPC